jgi:hypothetical protein
MTPNKNRKQARINRDELDMVLADLGVENPAALSTPQAIATLYAKAANSGLRKRTEVSF